MAEQYNYLTEEWEEETEMGILWFGEKSGREQETVSCAGCEKLVLKDRAIETNEIRFEYWEALVKGHPHASKTTFQHWCKECDPGYFTKIVLPDGDSRYYWHGFADVHGRRRDGWHEVE